MSSNVAVKVDHVSKFFKLPTESTQSLRTTLVNRFRGIKGTRNKKFYVIFLLRLKKVIFMVS